MTPRFPPLHDTPEPEHYGWMDDGLSRAERRMTRLTTFCQVALVALLLVMLAAHFSDTWRAATVHPDPVEVK